MIRPKVNSSSDNLLLVTESFFSVQGEGCSLGKPSFFLRLFGCHNQCSWCDSKHSWHPEFKNLAKRMTPEEAVGQVPMGHNVVITGGEPLLWMGKDGWEELLGILRKKHCTIEVETSGSHPPDMTTIRNVSQWNISPKLPSAQLSSDSDKSYFTLTHFLQRIRSTNAEWQLKFVVADDKDWECVMLLIERLQGSWNLTPLQVSKNIFVMPMCKTRDEYLERQTWLLDKVRQDGRINFTPRLHVIAWSDKRGV